MFASFALPIFASILTSSCTDERIVFRDRELFTPVQTAANGFVGYSGSAANLTVCGNCHIGQQGEWEGHGPGLPHVQNPDAVQPLAPMHVDTGLTYGCGECHSGVHHPFVQEWRRSGHAVAVASPAGRAECQQCHRGQQCRAGYQSAETRINAPQCQLSSGEFHGAACEFGLQPKSGVCELPRDLALLPRLSRAPRHGYKREIAGRFP